jgi:hypothetical protein
MMDERGNVSEEGDFMTLHWLLKLDYASSGTKTKMITFSFVRWTRQ